MSEEQLPEGSDAGEPQSTSWRRVALYAVLIWGCLATPLALFEYPEIVDYPSHLARHHLVANLAHDPVLQSFYEVRWRLLPNLGADLAVAALYSLTGLDIGVISRMVLAIALGGWIVAPVLLYRVLWQHWAIWPLAASLAAYNIVLFMGFENFYLTVPAALLVFAGFVATEGWAPLPRIGLLTAGAMVVWVGHLVAWGVLGLCVAGWATSTPGPASVRIRQLLQALVAFVPGLGLFLIQQWTAPARIGGITVWSHSAVQKLGVLLAPAMQFDPRVDSLHLLVFLPALFVLPALLGTLRVHPRLRVVLGLMGVIALAMPAQLLGISYMDQRLPCVLVLLCFAGTQVRVPWTIRTLMVALVGLGLVLRVGNRIQVWAAHEARVTDLVEVASRVIEPGQRVLPAGRVWLGHFHTADVLAYERSAFVPSLFTGAQLLDVTPAVADINHPAPMPMPGEWLEHAAQGTGPYAPGGDTRDYGFLRDWQESFDILLWMDDGPPPHAASLTLLAQGEWFGVYRIDR